MKTFRKKPNQWEDHYTLRARKEGWPARSVYKLMEIQERYSVIPKGGRVLDLGCAPGSWLLYAARTAGKSGRVTGVDLLPVAIALPGHATALTGDALEPDEEMAGRIAGPFDTVLSDMAPATTGRKDVDQARSLALCEAALAIALKVLAPGGRFVCKIFDGPDAAGFLETVRDGFDKVLRMRPKSVRKASKEIYVVGVGRKSV